MLVGHSLGELSALAAAGAVDEAAGLRLVALRGRLMERAAEEAGGDGGMLALSVSRDVGEALARGFGLTVANDNSPDQVVLSGERDWLEVLAEEAGQAGVRTTLLPIRGAFHSSAMAGPECRMRALSWSPGLSAKWLPRRGGGSTSVRGPAASRRCWPVWRASTVAAYWHQMWHRTGHAWSPPPYGHMPMAAPLRPSWWPTLPDLLGELARLPGYWSMLHALDLAPCDVGRNLAGDGARRIWSSCTHCSWHCWPQLSTAPPVVGLSATSHARRTAERQQMC